ncbi:Sucrase/ferredoxin-like-domain-containing protein [Mycena epipterygia]|nr:Sucrase/ferredoxin-like-domain-containing protein [Mycena epipterygia]
MSGLRKLTAWIFSHELDPDNIRTTFSASAVPVSTADCRTCSHPCKDGIWHADYPPRFNIDMETQMLGSVHPFRRQILISTGKTDWNPTVTATSGSLAAHISRVRSKIPNASSVSGDSDGQPLPRIPGIFDATDSCEISILSGSLKSISEDDGLETVLVFPDFIVIAGIPSILEGAQAMWKNALHPRIPRILGSSESTLRTWVLPYSCVITFCSHKRRDNRCAIAAPKFERAFTDSLERRGWSVDTQLEHIIGPPLEQFSGTVEEKDVYITHALKEMQNAKKALILFNSHIGSHKCAGNCIIYTASGSSVWYGRLTPHEVDAVVTNTIEGGLILPPLLRGGLNLSKPGCKTLHDW